MEQKDLFDGMEPGLARALMDGHRTLTEGAGDTRALDTIFTFCLRPIFDQLYCRENEMKVIELVQKKSGYFRVTPKIQLEEFKGMDLMVGIATTPYGANPRWFAENDRGGEYIPHGQAGGERIWIPVQPFMCLTEDDVRSGKFDALTNPLYFYSEYGCIPTPKSMLGYGPAAIARLWGYAWDFRGRNRLGSICLRDTLVHELIHAYDHHFNRGMDMSGETFTREDRKHLGEIGRLNADPVANAAAIKYHADRDKLALEQMSPWYRVTRFGKNDAEQLSRDRNSVDLTTLDKGRTLQMQLDEGRRNYGSLTDSEKSILKNYRDTVGRYKYQLYHMSNRELKSYLLEQVPSLLLRKEQGKPLDPKSTTMELANHVFDIQDRVEGNASFNARQDRHASAVLPDAKRSVYRRAYALVSAINELDLPDDMPLGQKIYRLKMHMDSAGPAGK